MASQLRDGLTSPWKTTTITIQYTKHVNARDMNWGFGCFQHSFKCQKVTQRLVSKYNHALVQHHFISSIYWLQGTTIRATTAFNIFLGFVQWPWKKILNGKFTVVSVQPVHIHKLRQNVLGLGHMTVTLYHVRTTAPCLEWRQGEDGCCKAANEERKQKSFGSERNKLYSENCETGHPCKSATCNGWPNFYGTSRFPRYYTWSQCHNLATCLSLILVTVTHLLPCFLCKFNLPM